jgi:hypothetical protein
MSSDSSQNGGPQSSGEPAQPPPMSLDRYAAIIDALGHAPSDLDETLASLGISEAEWDEADDYWQYRMSEEDSDEPSELLSRFVGSLEQLQQRHQGQSLDFDDWLSVMKSVQQGCALMEILEARGLSLAEFLSAQTRLMKELPKNPEWMARYQAVVVRGEKA